MDNNTILESDFYVPLRIKKISDSELNNNKQIIKPRKLYFTLRYFYLKNIKYRLISWKALSKFFKKKMIQQPTQIFHVERKKDEKLNELDFTMEIIKNNVNLYFQAQDYEEKKRIFDSFFESVQIHDR